MTTAVRIPAGEAVLESLGERLKRCRREKGWTQVELAHRSGVSQQTLTALERGVTQRSRFLPDIAAALGVSAEWLRTGVGEGAGSASSASECLVRPIPILDASEAADPEHHEVASAWTVIAGDAVNQFGQGSFALRLGPEEGALLTDGGPFRSGDMLICDTQAEPRPGDYAVVSIRERDRIDTGQLRRVQDGSWELLPLNDLYLCERLTSRDRIVAIARELRRGIR